MKVVFINMYLHVFIKKKNHKKNIACLCLCSQLDDDVGGWWVVQPTTRNTPCWQTSHQQAVVGLAKTAGELNPEEEQRAASDLQPVTQPKFLGNSWVGARSGGLVGLLCLVGSGAANGGVGWVPSSHIIQYR